MVAASEAAVEVERGERSKEGLGVKLKSPVSQTEELAAKAGVRVSVMKAARAVRPVHGQ